MQNVKLPLRYQERFRSIDAFRYYIRHYLKPQQHIHDDVMVCSRLAPRHLSKDAIVLHYVNMIGRVDAEAPTESPAEALVQQFRGTTVRQVHIIIFIECIISLH